MRESKGTGLSCTSDTGVTGVVTPSVAVVSHQEIPLEGEPSWSTVIGKQQCRCKREVLIGGNVYVWIMTYIYVCGDGRYNREKTKIMEYVGTCIFLMGLVLTLPILL